MKQTKEDKLLSVALDCIVGFPRTANTAFLSVLCVAVFTGHEPRRGRGKRDNSASLLDLLLVLAPLALMCDRSDLSDVIFWKTAL